MRTRTARICWGAVIMPAAGGKVPATEEAWVPLRGNFVATMVGACWREGRTARKRSSYGQHRGNFFGSLGAYYVHSQRRSSSRIMWRRKKVSDG
jgi:hypothetical protein